MTGISDIALVPAFYSREVVRLLQAALKRSENLRAAVAYWCIGLPEIGADLARTLSGDGFLCVDIHLPTDIDRLCELVQRGANVYLYLKHPNAQPGELKSLLPPHLMHSKMLFFDAREAESELWVGSHNWTVRAHSPAATSNRHWWFD